MNRYLPNLNNERGALMVIALLIVTTLTIAGIMVANEATLEGRAARNFSIRKQCMYAATAAALDLIQQMDGSTSAVSLTDEPWVYLDYDSYEGTEFNLSQVFSDWDTYSDAGGTWKSTVLAGAATPDGQVLDYMSQPEALAVQNEKKLESGKSNNFGDLYYIPFTIYGRAKYGHGGSNRYQVIVMIGYRTEIAT